MNIVHNRSFLTQVLGLLVVAVATFLLSTAFASAQVAGPGGSSGGGGGYTKGGDDDPNREINEQPCFDGTGRPLSEEDCTDERRNPCILDTDRAGNFIVDEDCYDGDIPHDPCLVGRDGVGRLVISSVAGDCDGSDFPCTGSACDPGRNKIPPCEGEACDPPQTRKIPDGSANTGAGGLVSAKVLVATLSREKVVK